MLRRAIARSRCDLAVLDPFVKVHALNEKDNPEMDFVCSLLIKIATDCNVAIDSPAHTRKGAIEAGDANARRGATSQRDAGRLEYTLTTMSEDEAKQFGISEIDRKGYVRLDKAKANLVRAMKATWLRLVNVPLGNATAEYPEGDEVQAIEVWTPPETWAGIEPEMIDAILDDIDRGLPDGRRYSHFSQVKEERQAWRVVQNHCPEKREALCKEIIRQWVKTGMLRREEYSNPSRRNKEQGLFADPDKRPKRVTQP